MPFLFPFVHNWSASYKIDIGYKTEVIESRVFREQRFALRTQPRKKVTIGIALDGLQLRSFLALMSARQQSEWVIPEITRAALLNAITFSGSGVLSFAVAPAWAVAGAYVVIKTPTGNAMFTVVSVLGAAVSVTPNAVVDLPIGTKVYPGLVGRLDQSLKGSLLTNTVGTVTVSLDADPGLNTYEAEATAPVSFNGRELFLTKPNWRTSPSLSLDGNLETIDYGRGRVVHNAPVNWNVETLRLEFLRRDAAEAGTLTSFFHRMKGQQGEFYMPTWGSDFDITTGALSGATVLNVPTTTSFDLFAASTVYKAAIIFFKDGSYQANRLVSITNVSGVSRHTFATTFPQAVNPTTVKLMCWLPAWRLAIDTLTLEWLTGTIAQAQLTMQTIEDLA